MYSVGEEFERLVEDDVEYLTCIANVNIGDREYLICENENGIKRVFFYDSEDDDIELLDEDESDHIIEIWEDDYYGTDKEYMYWNDESGEYDEVEKEEETFEEMDYDDYDSEDKYSSIVEYDEEELDDFLDDFLDDED